MERKVRSLYAEVLNLNAEDVFRDSDFTELGGDSAKAIKLVSLAKKAGLNISVPVRALHPHFSAGTMRLSAWLTIPV